ncbi:MAG: TIGR01777 family oxidoreductase [Oleibacter sp.]|nr:TIGR01777 family oxidoreductase [Thalassolituus sp.]
MAKRIFITGGTGFIGSKLIDQWIDQGHVVTVLTRQPVKARARWSKPVTAISDLNAATERYDWLINLAGEGIAEKRWTASRKTALRNSRINLTERLVRWAESTGQKFEKVLTGSAVGVYGSFAEGPTPALTEDAACGDDFSAHLCTDWETAAKGLARFTKQLTYLRTGIVLGPNGGMLQRLWLPFKLGLGGRIGDGTQVLSWIHLDDYCRAVDLLLADKGAGSEHGVFNMVAPQAVTNREFTETLAKTIKRPALFPMPTLVAKTLFGEMGDLLLKGQRVAPAQLVQHGFSFQYPDLDVALTAINSKW